jgi:sugar/nucleoside kinase (ribokinase family)
MADFDLALIGAVSKDHNIDPDAEEFSTGGAVVYAAGALYCQGADFTVITRCHPDDRACLDVFPEETDITALPSSASTAIENTYHTADRDRRTCRAISMADPFTIEDIPPGINAGVWYFGGLMRGEVPEDLVLRFAEKGKTAIDAQGWLRVNEGGNMVFRDWPRKREVISAVHYFKCDAAEAEILTGETNRAKAARILHDWGAREVVLTHHSEVLVCVEGGIHTAPFRARNLSGRTGRGDTCFSTWCYQRKRLGPGDACRFTAALTSLKMEKPGPFSGSVEAVEDMVEKQYA